MPGRSSVPASPVAVRLNFARMKRMSFSTSRLPTQCPSSGSAASRIAQAEKTNAHPTAAAVNLQKLVPIDIRHRAMWILQASFAPDETTTHKGRNSAVTTGRAGGMNRPASMMSALTDQASQSLAVGAAGSELCSIAQEDRVLTMEPRLESLDAVEIDHRRSMDAQKAIGIQSFLEALQTVSKQVLLRANMDLDVIAERLEPIDFGDSDEIDPLLGSDRDPALSLSLRADRFQQRQKTRLDSGAAVGLPQSSQRMFHRPGEPRPGERFEQVVDRVHLEGAQCECVIRGDENDRGRGSGIELL